MIRMICAGLLLAVCACVGSPGQGDGQSNGKAPEPVLATASAAVCIGDDDEFPTTPTLTLTDHDGTAADNNGTVRRCWRSGDIWHCLNWHSCGVASGCCSNKWLAANCIKGPNTQCINCQGDCEFCTPSR